MELMLLVSLFRMMVIQLFIQHQVHLFGKPVLQIIVAVIRAEERVLIAVLAKTVVIALVETMTAVAQVVKLPIVQENSQARVRHFIL